MRSLFYERLDPCCVMNRASREYGSFSDRPSEDHLAGLVSRCASLYPIVVSMGRRGFALGACAKFNKKTQIPIMGTSFKKRGAIGKINENGATAAPQAGQAPR